LSKLLRAAVLLTTTTWVAPPLRANAAEQIHFPSAQQILERADEARLPQQEFEVVVTVRDLRHGRVARFRVLSKSDQAALVLTLEPARQRGRALLVQGRRASLYAPRASRPLRSSLAFRLSGQVAYADVTLAKFTGAYIPKLVGTELMGSEALYILELLPAQRGLPYERVLYWVRRRDYAPFKAEFYGRSNRPLKTSEWSDFRMLGEKVRPAMVIYSDGRKPTVRSALEYSELKLRKLPDQIFTEAYLKRLY
jgi:hypothetical protein